MNKLRNLSKTDRKHIKIIYSCLFAEDHSSRPFVRIVLDCINKDDSLEDISRLARIVAFCQYMSNFNVPIDDAPDGEQWKKLKNIDNQLKNSDCSSWYYFTTAPFITKNHAQWAIDRFTHVSEEAKTYHEFIKLFKAETAQDEFSRDEYLELKNR